MDWGIPLRRFVEQGLVFARKRPRCGTAALGLFWISSMIAFLKLRPD
jgi:hypothetical protein